MRRSPQERTESEDLVANGVEIVNVFDDNANHTDQGTALHSDSLRLKEPLARRVALKQHGVERPKTAYEPMLNLLGAHHLHPFTFPIILGYYNSCNTKHKKHRLSHACNLHSQLTQNLYEYAVKRSVLEELSHSRSSYLAAFISPCEQLPTFLYNLDIVLVQRC